MNVFAVLIEVRPRAVRPLTPRAILIEISESEAEFIHPLRISADARKQSRVRAVRQQRRAEHHAPAATRRSGCSRSWALRRDAVGERDFPERADSVFPGSRSEPAQRRADISGKRPRGTVADDGKSPSAVTLSEMP